MLLADERNEIIEFGKKLVTHGLTKGTGGNISSFNRDMNLFAITPSSMDYFSLIPENIVVMDLDNNIIEGSAKPSSEYAMHSIIYRNRDDICSVVHTHSEGATVMACMGWHLPPFYYLNMIGGRDIRCIPYIKYGTEKLAEEALAGLKDRYAVYLGNHGLLSAGKDLSRAFKIAEIIETASNIYIKCRMLGSPKLLTEEEIEEMLEVFHGKNYI